MVSGPVQRLAAARQLAGMSDNDPKRPDVPGSVSDYPACQLPPGLWKARQVSMVAPCHQAQRPGALLPPQAVLRLRRKEGDFCCNGFDARA